MENQLDFEPAFEEAAKFNYSRDFEDIQNFLRSEENTYDLAAIYNKYCRNKELIGCKITGDELLYINNINNFIQSPNAFQSKLDNLIAKIRQIADMIAERNLSYKNIVGLMEQLLGLRMTLYGDAFAQDSSTLKIKGGYKSYREA